MINKIGIIGGGNLGIAIAEGLIQSGFISPGHILITRRSIDQLNALERKGVMVSANNEDALNYAGLIILAVKPFQVNEVLTKLKGCFKKGKHILVSVVTGVRPAFIRPCSRSGSDRKGHAGMAIAIREHDLTAKDIDL
jgi:pyrroline-5-carboxylate reductase